MPQSNETDSVRVSIDGDLRPSIAIVEAASALTDTEPTDLPPLSSYVNPDSVDGLFADRDDGRIDFEYAGCRLTVVGDTAVTARPT